MELNLIREVVYNYGNENEPDSTKRDHLPIDKIISSMQPETAQQAQNLLTKYETTYQEQATYLGSGETTTTFKVGPKVIKFGGKRHHDDIPFCLPIDSAIQYDKYSYMYVTDCLDTKNIPEGLEEIMYFNLRNSGYVWLDPKPTNIGLLNNIPKILDDVDIQTEEEVKAGRKRSVLDAVSHTDSLALLELKYLQLTNPNFDLSQINTLFANESPATQERINHLREEFIRQNRTYSQDEAIESLQQFAQLLNIKINESNQNQISTSNTKTATI